MHISCIFNLEKNLDTLLILICKHKYTAFTGNVATEVSSETTLFYVYECIQYNLVVKIDRLLDNMSKL